MLWTIIIILLILWLLGFFGRNINPKFPRTGNWIHILIVLPRNSVTLSAMGSCLRRGCSWFTKHQGYPA
jgi:hypothetical protein